MAKIEWTERRRRGWRLTAADGATETLKLPDRYTDMSCTVHPGAGGTLELLASCADPSLLDGADAGWVAIQFGDSATVSADDGQALDMGLTGLRLSASGAAAEARIALTVRGL